MADNLNNLYDTYTGVNENSQGTDGSQLDTGDLLRTFDFSDKVYKLKPEVDPLFTFVSKLKKETTSDPEFKYAEERDVTHLRHGYILGALEGTGNGTTLSDYVGIGVADAAGSGKIGNANTAGDQYTIAVGADYKWSGNIASVYGNANAEVPVGAAGTTPQCFLAGQILKIPLKTAKASKADGVNSNDTWADDTDREGMIDMINAKLYERKGTTVQSLRTIVVGTAFAMGSGGPESFVNQPISTGYGHTQIFKTSLKMDNTSRATEYKFNSDQWLYNWKKKLILHKWDIAHAGLFGKKYKDETNKRLYTQGVVDYISKYGNQFTLNYDTKGIEDFMDDLEIFLDPRFNNAKPTVFMMDTRTWAWMNKLSGLATNSLDAMNDASTGSPFGYNFQSLGMKNFFGVNANVVSTPAGTIKLVKNTHLDGTDIAILGVNLNNAKYRPLNGNGINRDTKVYPAVKSLEHTGDDYREDQILTEAGFEWSMPETHAIWGKVQ